MNLIDIKNKEIQMMITVAKIINESNSCVEKLPKSDSYYKQSSQSTELAPYSFENIAEMRQKLNELWKTNKQMQGFIPVVLAASFKNRKKTDATSTPLIEHKENSTREVLPIYTYTL